MKKQEVIEGLKTLIDDREALIMDEEDTEDIFVQDKRVLEEAIKIIKGDE
jgi:translation elongation factor P/translation initiation factor 5A